MRDDFQLRPNYYPNGPYKPSPCIYCGQMLKHTGSHSGVTWTPMEIRWRGEWATCYGHEVAPATFGQHEPWEVTPVGQTSP